MPKSYQNMYCRQNKQPVLQLPTHFAKFPWSLGVKGLVKEVLFWEGMLIIIIILIDIRCEKEDSKS